MSEPWWKYIAAGAGLVVFFVSAFFLMVGVS